MFVASLRNDRAHGPDSADLRARAVLEQSGDSPVVPVEPPQVHFWTKLLSFRQCRGPDSENCPQVLQFLFIEGRRHSGLYAEADPHGPGCADDHRDFAVR